MRSLLFVPADSPKKLDKALASAADALIVDLEDSIAAETKEAARASAAAFLKDAAATTPRPRLLVRINGLASGLADADLEALVAARPDGIVLPKAEGGASIIHLDAKLTAWEAIHGWPDGGIKILAFAIESAKALFLAGTFAQTSLRLAGLTWGVEDLAADLGAKANRGPDGHFLDPYRLARSLCLAAAAAAQVPAIDTIRADFRDAEGLRRETENAARDGFAAKLAIHPAQVVIINEIFTPTAEAIARAQAIVDAFAANVGTGVVAIDGVMYDRPHLVRAEQLLARAKVN
jgi:citrate lyase subunit beta/citryl-CoA lyase